MQSWQVLMVTLRQAQMTWRGTGGGGGGDKGTVTGAGGKRTREQGKAGRGCRARQPAATAVAALPSSRPSQPSAWPSQPSPCTHHTHTHADLHAFAALHAQRAPHRPQHHDAVSAGGDEGVLQRRQAVDDGVVAVEHLVE